ncbi:MAG: baeRF3 domain-containing protein [Bacteroidia bacterium]
MKNSTFLNNELISELLSVTEDPCISIYLPTHRNFSEKKEDVGQFKGLVRQIEKSLAGKYAETDIKSILEPFEELSNDYEFWNNTADALAVFKSPGYFKLVILHEPVEPLAIVAYSFHTKPLRHYLQTLERYHVLGLTLREFKLYEGNRHLLREIELAPGIPHTLVDALGDELTEKHTTVASFGGVGNQSTGMHYGLDDKKAEIDKDAERFFRIVAKNVEEHYSKPTGWPLILAALPEHHSTFRDVNKNSCLHAKAISINPAAISIDKLRDLAWEIMEPEYKEKLAAEVERFEQARADSKGSDIPKVIAKAAFAGKIDTLLVEENRLIAVRVSNLVSGQTDIENLNKPGVDDLIDELGELVVLKGGKVIVLPKDKMPTDTGLAAIFRY